MDSRKFPPISQELLEALEHLFPDSMPDVSLTAEEIRVRQGEVKVTRFLRQKFEEQNRTVLESS